MSILDALIIKHPMLLMFELLQKVWNHIFVAMMQG